jgi:hypothetical protein
MKLSWSPKLVEKLVWVPVILHCRIFIPSYAFDALFCWNWPFSPYNRETLRITLILENCRHVSFCSPLTNWALVFIGSLLLSDLMFQACTTHVHQLQQAVWLCILWQVQTSNQGWFKREMFHLKFIDNELTFWGIFYWGFKLWHTQLVFFFPLKVIISVFWRNSKCETKDTVAWAFKSVQLY